jgi:1-aminocyclopropane-1-carboxylate deaminase/D-cysteine desulfhydrase-like pyridoxal-dependent ACC family enzyme
MDDSSHLKKVVFQELLRQAHYSYNVALVVTAGSSLMTLAGILVKTPAVSVPAVSVTLTSISCIQFAKESREKLCQMLKQLHD